MPAFRISGAFLTKPLSTTKAMPIIGGDRQENDRVLLCEPLFPSSSPLTSPCTRCWVVAGITRTVRLLRLPINRARRQSRQNALVAAVRAKKSRSLAKSNRSRKDRRTHARLLAEKNVNLQVPIVSRMTTRQCTSLTCRSHKSNRY